MPVAIPNSEPQSITAGETVQWTQSLPDYPAPTWTLKYALQASGKALITVTATASGTSFAVTIDAATSSAFAPGVYTWTAFVESVAVRHTVARGTVTIIGSPLSAIGSTHGTRMLALIEAALEGRIPNGLEKTDIDGQMLERIPVPELFKLRSYYQTVVATEENKAAIAAGLPNRRNSYVRFRRVQ